MEEQILSILRTTCNAWRIKVVDKGELSMPIKTYLACDVCHKQVDLTDKSLADVKKENGWLTINDGGLIRQTEEERQSLSSPSSEIDTLPLEGEYCSPACLLRKMGVNPLVDILKKRIAKHRNEIAEHLAKVENIASNGKTSGFADVSKFQYRVYEIAIAIAELKTIREALLTHIPVTTDDSGAKDINVSVG